MNLLDEEGRLFGVINIFDIFVLLLVVGIVVAAGIYVVPNIFVDKEEVSVQFQLDNQPRYIANSISSGPVPSNSNIVRILNKSSTQSRLGQNASTSSMEIWVRIRANSENEKWYYNGERIYVGKQVTLDFGNVIVDANVTEMPQATG
jgi:hypothetical protein